LPQPRRVSRALPRPRHWLPQPHLRPSPTWRPTA
jgi:hypothetical protein